ncbi:MAG: TraR/DksA family transcriptional regulator [Planctomycetota bacterium]
MATWTKQRDRLEELLQHLERRTEKIGRDLTREDAPLSPDFKEQAVTRQNDEVLDGLEREGFHQIELVRSALARLESGDYETCSDCGHKIKRARLEALPYAVHCIACAEKRESVEAAD